MANGDNIISTKASRDPTTGYLLPGARLNPGGKPKNIVSFTKTLRDHLQRHPEDALDTIKSVVKEAKRGNMVAANALWDRIDGKVIEKHEFEPMPIRIIFEPTVRITPITPIETIDSTVKELPIESGVD